VTRHVVSIDLGTSRAKVGIVNDRLEILSTANASYQTYVDQADMAEQSPAEWIDAITRAWGDVREERPDVRIDAIVLTAQMPTLVELDQSNEVIGRAVTWQDSRADELVGELLDDEQQRRVYEVTGAPIDGRYLIPMYLRRRRDSLPEPSFVLSAKDYLYYMLTGCALTDPSTASGFGNYDLKDQCFSDELNELWGFDPVLLPGIEPSGSSHPLAASGARILLGLEEQHVPVVLGAADSVAAFHFVERVFGPAMAIIDGSSTVILGNVDDGRDLPFEALVSPLVDADRRGLEMDLLATGSSIAWLARLFGRSASDLESLAQSVESKSSNDVLFEPYLAGGEQGALWRDDLAGAISHLRLGSTQGDIALALFEGIAFEVLRCLDAMAPVVQSSSVTWLMSGDNAGLLPALVASLDDYAVRCVRGHSPSLLGAALVALEALREKLDLTSPTGTMSSEPIALDHEYVTSLKVKRVRYLAAQAGAR